MAYTRTIREMKLGTMPSSITKAKVAEQINHIQIELSVMETEIAQIVDERDSAISLVQQLRTALDELACGKIDACALCRSSGSCSRRARASCEDFIPAAIYNYL